MRLRHPLAVLTLVAACADDGPRSLPTGDVIGRNAFHVVGDDAGLAWFELTTTATGWTVSLWEHRGAAAEKLDESVDRMHIDSAGYFLLRDGDERVWGAGTAFMGCGAARWLRPGAPAVELALWEPDDVCRVLPIALRAGVLWYATPTWAFDAPSVEVSRVELASDQRRVWREPPGVAAFGALSAGDDGFVMTSAARDSVESRLVRFALPVADPDEGWVGPTIGELGALGQLGGLPVWIDNGAAGQSPRVQVTRPAPGVPGDLVVETRATLPAPARRLVVAGDAVWASPRVLTEVTTSPPRELWRVTADGQVTTFGFDGEVRAFTATGDGAVWVAVAPELVDGTPPRFDLVRLAADGERTTFAADGDIAALVGTTDALAVVLHDLADRPDVDSELVRHPLTTLQP